MSTTETQAVPAGTWAVDKVHSDVAFAVDYMAGTFTGSFSDFDAAVTDGGNPPKLQSAYATWTSADGSGDGLHPSPAGYQKMADSVDLSLFSK